jgi:histone deacetylase 6
MVPPLPYYPLSTSLFRLTLVAGDGLQELFYEDDRVLYVSIHSHEHQPGIFYDSNGELTACGSGKGLGYNVNIPLPYRTSSASDAGDGAGGRAEAGYGDKDYDFLLKELVVPISQQFDPQLVIIAAGFDACAGDPVGGNRLRPEWFGKTTALFQVGSLP